MLSRRRLVAYLADLLWNGFVGVPQAAPARPKKTRARMVALEGGVK